MKPLSSAIYGLLQALIEILMKKFDAWLDKKEDEKESKDD